MDHAEWLREGADELALIEPDDTINVWTLDQDDPDEDGPDPRDPGTWPDDDGAA